MTSTKYSHGLAIALWNDWRDPDTSSGWVRRVPPPVAPPIWESLLPMRSERDSEEKKQFEPNSFFIYLKKFPLQLVHMQNKRERKLFFFFASVCVIIACLIVWKYYPKYYSRCCSKSRGSRGPRDSRRPKGTAAGSRPSTRSAHPSHCFLLI